MNFQPVIPVGGVAGLAFIERTREKQQAVFDQSPQLKREMDYFRENISGALKAEDLVKDRMLLKVALGAFGLDDDIGKKYFIQKILEEGTEDRSALAVKLVDTRYRNLAETFGYGNETRGTNVLQSDFSERILDQFRTRQFEVAVGNADNSVRLALNFKREVASYLPESDEVDKSGTAWFRIMGNTPMRTVFEKAFRLPTAVGTLDIDRQKEIFETKAQQFFGTSSFKAFEDPENVEEIVRNFLSQSQIESGPNSATPGMAALSLLNASGLGAGASAGLLLSSTL